MADPPRENRTSPQAQKRKSPHLELRMGKEERSHQVTFIFKNTDGSIGLPVPVPEPAEEVETPRFPDIGQGFRGTAPLDRSQFSNAAYYAAHKSEIEALLRYEAGEMPGSN
jgi:hypothetical protein